MMKLLVVNAGNKSSSTSKLTNLAIEGFMNIQREWNITIVDLMDLNIGYCRNCKTCMNDTTSTPYTKCTIKDDMGQLNDHILESDAIIFSSPVHMGNTTGAMLNFLERVCYTHGKATKTVMTIKGVPEPRHPKNRPYIVIETSGIVSPIYRLICNEGVKTIKSVANDCLGGVFVGHLYAGNTHKKGAERYKRKAIRLGEKLGSKVTGLN
jgi:NAD(P)H-dependent FMN reductase